MDLFQAIRNDEPPLVSMPANASKCLMAVCSAPHRKYKEKTKFWNLQPDLMAGIIRSKMHAVIPNLYRDLHLQL
jgi:hypothetical protein